MKGWLNLMRVLAMDYIWLLKAGWQKKSVAVQQSVRNPLMAHSVR